MMMRIEVQLWQGNLSLLVIEIYQPLKWCLSHSKLQYLLKKRLNDLVLGWTILDSQSKVTRGQEYINLDLCLPICSSKTYTTAVQAP